MSGTFPSGWPPGCPPADAEDAGGTVYRLVSHDPPRAEDFVTHHENNTRPQAPPCLRAGLSVFRTLDDVIHQQNLFPALGDRVAKGALESRHGKTRLTPGKQPTHTT